MSLPLLNGIPFLGGITLIQNGRFFDGSAAAPSISFLNEPDFGFYRQSAGLLGLSNAAGTSWSLLFSDASRIFGAHGTNYLELPVSGAINLIAGGTNQSIFLTPSGSGAVNLKSTGIQTMLIDASNTARILYLSVVAGYAYIQSEEVSIAYRPLALNPAGGSVLFGTTTDSANGRLQLATHTTAAGGIGFGTDASLYRNAAGSLSTTAHVLGQASIKSSHPTDGVGYATGAGGTVTQATSKATGVTLNKVTGEITLNNASLAAATTVSFTLTNSAIAATDHVLVDHVSVGALGSYNLTADPAAGSAVIYVRNITAGALAEAIVLKITVIKTVTA